MLRFCDRRVVCGVARKIFGPMKSGYIGYVRTIRIAGVVATFLFVIMAIAAFFPVVKRVNSADAAGMPSTSSINITSVSNTANVDILLDNEEGTFAASDSDISFDVTTNNLTGYTLMLADNGTAGRLVNTDFGDALDTLVAVTDANTFENGSADTYSNRWGFKPSKYNSLDNTNYVPAPIADAKTVLNVTGCANGTAGCSNAKDSYTIGVGARVDYAKSEGVYTNTYALVALANVISYEINFFDTTSDSTVTGLPGTESGTDTAIAKYVLPNTTPTREGYTFNGWCLGTVTNVASGDSTCVGDVYNPGASYENFNDPANLANIINFYAMWKVNTYNITIKATTGASKVTLNGVDCTSTSGCIVANLTFGKSYNLSATMATGYLFSGWNISAYGSAVDGLSASTQYIVGAGDSTIIPTTMADGHSVVIKPTTGISKITLGGVDCTSTSGCTVTGLLNGVSYNLVATLADGYIFSGWEGGTPGTIASSTNITTQYTVGNANATITAKATIKTYTVYKKYKLQNVDGTYPSDYTSDGSVTVNHGSTVTYTRAATESHQQASKTSAAITENGTTVYLDVPRKTYTVIKQYKLQNANGTYPSDYTPDGTATVRHGDSITYSRAATASHQAASKKSGTVTADTTISLDVPRNVYTCTIKVQYQNADGTWTNPTTAINGETRRYGETCAWSRKADTTYQAANYSGSNTNIDTTVSVYRNTYKCTIKVKYQNVDGTWTNPTTVINGETRRWDQTCAWSRKADATYQAADYSGKNATIDATVSVYRNTFKCYKRYHLQKADGSYPTTWVDVTTETGKLYGSSCSYSQSYSGYQTQSTNAQSITKDVTLSLELPRNTYSVTVNNGSGGGKYRWDQTVNISANAAGTGKHFTSWTVSNATAANASASSTSFTMPQKDVTATANYAWNTYKVVFNGNGATGGSTATQNFTYGTAQSLTLNGFKRTNYYFKGWATSASGGVTYADRASVNNLSAANGATITLYAVWAKINACGITTTGSNYEYSAHGYILDAPCYMLDRDWAWGNNKQRIAWSNAFENGSGNDTNGSVKSGICPAGFQGIRNNDANAIIKDHGGTSYTSDISTYKVTGSAGSLLRGWLGINELYPEANAAIWTRTQKDNSNAYRMLLKYDDYNKATVYAGASLGKTSRWFVLCYRARS